MSVIIDHAKALSASPLKISAPLGAAMAFMGMRGCLPMFHGSQGCTAFALVMMVRHFREAIPLQTTAMNEISTILGGMDQVEQGLLNIARRARPEMIGVISTALTETRGEDMSGELKLIRARNPELAEIAVVDVSAPDFTGSLETGWGKAVSAIIRQCARPPAAGEAPLNQVTLLPGSHLTPGDVAALKDIIADFGLEAIVLPDLAQSLDGHVPDSYTPTTLGGTSVAQLRDLGRSRLTIAIGEHMRISARTLEEVTGVPFVLLDRVTGLAAVDQLMKTLAAAAGVAVPPRQRRARSQLVDAMLDGHFYFAGRSLALAGEPALVTAYGRLACDLGARLAAVVTSEASPELDRLPCDRVVVGDFADLETELAGAGDCHLIIANSNGRQLAAKTGLPHFRAGFPVFDRLGAAHVTTAGYAGTRDLVNQLGNILMDGGSHGHPATAAG
ncbi:MAG TPA: nitrogenase iron-molybdenum cofactor biosynthesis protein NifN [Rhodospirillaceae bacterium]|nr:nitrogenase iron-molybdenum cofactor biosynthesis protein NifN [Rhodospirillaceae bacterium]